MKPNYIYKANTVGFSEQKIDLLRNKYVYNSIEYSEIEQVDLKLCLTRTWVLQLVFAFVMLSSAFIIIQYVITFSASIGGFFYRLSILWQGVKGSGIIVVALLIAFGVYIGIYALKKQLHIFINTSKKSYKIDIREISKNMQTKSLKLFLDQKIKKAA